MEAACKWCCRKGTVGRHVDIDAARLGPGKLGISSAIYLQFMPDATKQQADWFNDLQHETSSPENAARYLEAVGEADVAPLLASIAVPTLVMHARRDARVPFEAGRLVAAGIPGAPFVPLESRNHLFLEHEPAFARFIEEIEAFLRS
jgi:pimeloyl-ACP methyl ester carboxylesterase